MNVDDEAWKVRSEGDCSTERTKELCKRSEYRCERRDTRKKSKMELEKRSDNIDERLDFCGG